MRFIRVWLLRRGKRKPTCSLVLSLSCLDGRKFQAGNICRTWRWQIKWRQIFRFSLIIIDTMSDTVGNMSVFFSFNWTNQHINTTFSLSLHFELFTSIKVRIFPNKIDPMKEKFISLFSWTSEIFICHLHRYGCCCFKKNPNLQALLVRSLSSSILNDKSFLPTKIIVRCSFCPDVKLTSKKRDLFLLFHT